jgi:hypothetical protein
MSLASSIFGNVVIGYSSVYDLPHTVSHNGLPSRYVCEEHNVDNPTSAYHVWLDECNTLVNLEKPTKAVKARKLVTKINGKSVVKQLNRDEEPTVEEYNDLNTDAKRVYKSYEVDRNELIAKLTGNTNNDTTNDTTNSINKDGKQIRPLSSTQQKTQEQKAKLHARMNKICANEMKRRAKDDERRRTKGLQPRSYNNTPLRYAEIITGYNRTDDSFDGVNETTIFIDESGISENKTHEIEEEECPESPDEEEEYGGNNSYSELLYRAPPTSTNRLVRDVPDTVHEVKVSSNANHAQRSDTLFQLLTGLQWRDKDEAVMKPQQLNKINLVQLRQLLPTMRKLADELFTAIHSNTGALDDMDEEDKYNFLYHVIAKGSQFYFSAITDPEFCMYLLLDEDNKQYQPLYTYIKRKLGDA